MTANSPLQDALYAALTRVEDPELRRPITELGMVETALVHPELDEHGEPIPGRHWAEVTVLLTIEGCPLKNTIEQQVRDAAATVEGIERVQLQDISEDIEDLEEAIDDIDTSEGEEKDAEEQETEEQGAEDKNSEGTENGTEHAADKAERPAKDSAQDPHRGDLSQPQSRESQQAQQQAERTREGGARDH